jgi:gas vesicle protein
MTDDEELDLDESAEDDPEDEGVRDRGGFLSGLLVGAAVGAVLALAFAPRSGEETRRLVRRRTGKLAKEAGERVRSARDDVREALREKKDALRQRLAKGVEALEEGLGD